MFSRSRMYYSSFIHLNENDQSAAINYESKVERKDTTNHHKSFITVGYHGAYLNPKRL